MLKLKINGIDVEAPEGSSVLEAALNAGFIIPTLCFLKHTNEIGACRICVVEVKGMRSFAASCVLPASNGMEVLTNTPALRESRKLSLELILSNHRMDCLSCKRNLSCELQKLALEYAVDQNKFSTPSPLPAAIDSSAPHLVRDNSKCILCRRCVSVCDKLQHVAVIGTNDRGFASHIGSPFDMPLNDTSCTYCGQCITVCPTGALTEKDDTPALWRALADPDKFVVVAAAPAIRVQLGESFNFPIGTNVVGKLAASLRRLGFDRVFDIDTAADLTIMEEGTELLLRLKNGGPLPLITSCSPGWIKFCEHYFPDLIPNLSSCKSPQQMYGAIMKTYYAQKENIAPENIVVVSVMPCVAKKFEAQRDDQAASGFPDVDISITTRELAAMIKQAGIDFSALPDEDFDPAFGIASGAGHIFGAAGGVMEAALRTVAETLTGSPVPNPVFNEVRGSDGIKEAEYNLNGTTIRVAAASGLSNAKKLLDLVKSGEKDYHFIEIMACPGGCVNGGGQPYQSGHTRSFTDLRSSRAAALYSEDERSVLRKSHENPIVKQIYDDFLGEPGSDKSHHILHTSYVKRDVY